jgi:hypothetical protein
MYCTREASERHDKIFALLGMSSDDPTAAGLSPDYGIPWEGLLERLVRYLFGEQVAVKTWPERELAVIRGKGHVLGHISSKHADRDGRQQVAVTFIEASGNSEVQERWSLPPSGESVEVDDLVCLFDRAPGTTIIRPQKDHFSVIMIAAPPLQLTQSTSNILHDLLLIWDWEKARENPGGRKEDVLWMESRIPERSDTDVGGHLDGMTTWEMGLISEDGGKYGKAGEEFQETIGDYEARFGEENSLTLTARERLVSIYWKAKRWEEAMELAGQLIQTRMQFLGTGHPDTARSRAILASIYGDPRRRFLTPQQRQVIKRIIEQREAPITEDEVETIAESYNAEQMELLLDQRGDEVRITEAVLMKAAGNPYGAGMMKAVLDRVGNEVKITEAVFVKVVGHQDDTEVMRALYDQHGDSEALETSTKLHFTEMMKAVLDRVGNEVKITEAVLMEAAGNPYGTEMMGVLLDRVGDEAKITEAVLMKAAGNQDGTEMIKTLLDRVGDEAKITEAVLMEAAGNEHCGEEVMRVLLERGGDEVKITEAVLVKAAGTEDGMMMDSLLERGGDKVNITEAVLIAAAGSQDWGEEVMEVLLERGGDKVKITEAVLIEAAGNRDWGGEMMKILLEREGDKVKITEAVLMEAARNRDCGEKVMRVLLERGGDEVKMMEAVRVKGEVLTGCFGEDE